MSNYSVQMFEFCFGCLPQDTPDEKKEAAFAFVESRLSPENLSCDGERPRSVQHAVAKELNGIWATLEARFGEKREPQY